MVLSTCRDSFLANIYQNDVECWNSSALLRVGLPSWQHHYRVKKPGCRSFGKLRLLGGWTTVPEIVVPASLASRAHTQLAPPLRPTESSKGPGFHPTYARR
jgi:hypothetical protein